VRALDVGWGKREERGLRGWAGGERMGGWDLAGR
jgi:hypothetical protein